MKALILVPARELENSEQRYCFHSISVITYRDSLAPPQSHSTCCKFGGIDQTM